MQCQKLKTYMETGRVVFLPARSIRPNPAQPRKIFRPEALDELSDSIRQHGILQPLSVRRSGNGYELIAGERRLRAAELAGLPGAFCATLGVVLPSFVIILLIAAALHSLMKYAGVNAFLAGVRPCVVAMILATACTMGLSTLGGFTTVSGGFAPDVRALAVFALLGILHFAYKKKTQKAPSPIGMILLSAVLGAVLWSI